MCRKIACFLTAAFTLVLMAGRVFTALYPDTMFAAFHVEDFLIAISFSSYILTTVLCFSKRYTVAPMKGGISSVSGWIATFGGAMLIMSVVLDSFCWLVYHQVPPPNETILNNVDYCTLILSLVCGVLGGVFLILQGFQWMAGSFNSPKLLSWLSLTPVLWMWFRLARYEISYASTIDITHSFFDFAALVTMSLFFLQLARMVTGVGAQPKNSLMIFALFATVSSLSGAALTFYQLSHGVSISTLLIAVVDATLGLLAFVIAIAQSSAQKQDIAKEQEEPQIENDEFAWTTPAKERKPLDPPFSIDEKLPMIDEIMTENNTETPAKVDTTLTVDDILAELDK